MDLAALLSGNRLAQLVGAPTGGAPSGYGDILTMQHIREARDPVLEWLERG